MSHRFPRPYLRAIGTHGVALLLALTAVGGAFADQADEGLKFSMGDAGPATLSYQGENLLASGTLHLDARAAGQQEGKLDRIDLRGATTAVDGRTVTRSHGEIVASVAYRQAADVLHINVTIRNTGERTFERIDLRPMTLRFPSRPEGGRWMWGYQVATNNDGEPGVVTADYGSAMVLACVDQIERPVTFGFAGNYGNHPNNALLVLIEASIKPGQTVEYPFSLRFGPGDADPMELASEIYQKFAETFPYKLDWPDRRPIGAIMACRSGMNWETNPRGWLNDPKIDITTEEGLAEFHKEMLAYADRAVQELKDVGAQGMIMWSIEGEQMPHALTYLGDPRVLPESAPEMDAIADQWFKKFTDAGLKVGVCIRPSRVIPNGKGGWKHRQVEDHVSEMADKIAYAKKRWGATLFYMDTNVKWPMRGPEDQTRGMWQGNAQLLASEDLYELTKRHPDTLIVPEFGRFGYWSCCMPYGELRGGKRHTSATIRSVYPKAGSAITIADGDFIGNYNGLLRGALEGDVFLFRGWFSDPRNDDLKLLLREAEYIRRSTDLQPPIIGRALESEDPVIRYAALDAINAGNRHATEVILRHADKEADWVVRKKMAETLGALGNPAAVDQLVAWIRDRKAGIDRFAAEALGQVGRPAEARLAELAEDEDQRVAVAALEALGEFNAPHALPTIHKLVGSENKAVRLAAIDAMGVQRNKASVNKLTLMLPKTDDVGELHRIARSLGRMGDARAVEPLIELMHRATHELRNNGLRVAVARALEDLTDKQHGPYEKRWRKSLEAGEIGP